MALIHLIKMNVGIGVMAMPTAFYNAGMVVGIFAMAFMAFVTVHCMHLLVKIYQFSIPLSTFSKFQVNAGQIMTERTQAEFLDYAEVVEVTVRTSRFARFQKAAK